MQMALSSHPHSLDDLIAVSGLARGVVARFVRELQDSRMVRVADWARDPRGYPTIRKYALGGEPDTLCPRKNETSAIRMKALREKRKGETT